MDHDDLKNQSQIVHPTPNKLKGYKQMKKVVKKIEKSRGVADDGNLRGDMATESERPRKRKKNNRVNHRDIII